MSSVRDYYQANTSTFLLFGSEGAIHRELWAPGVSSKAEAVHYAHQLVLNEFLALCEDGRGRILDLGCGVGAAARFIAERVPARVYGVSISPDQIARATGWPRQRPLVGDASFFEGDFCALAQSLEQELRDIDLVFAIEAFVHTPSAEAFLATASRSLRPGGRLVIIDDFLADSAPAVSPLLEDFKAGWHIGSLLSISRLAELARRHALLFDRSTDLSSMQRLGRPRDHLIRALQPFLRLAQRRSLWAQSLVGGDALQRAHRTGLLTYSLARFVKQGVPNGSGRSGR